MISLSIDRTSLSLLPLTIVDSGRTAGTYVLAADGWQPGAVQRDNALAQSRWISGAQLVSTRTELVTMDLTVRLWASSLSALRTMGDTLGEALGQFGYTITETGMTFAPTVYTCLPASYRMEFDPVQLSQFTALFTASIPRQP